MPEPDPNQESSTEDQKPDPYQAAEQLLEHGLLEKCRDALNAVWSENIFAPRAIQLYASLTREMGKDDVADTLDRLYQKLSESQDQPYKHHQEIFDAGYAMVEIRQHEIASLLLKTLHKELPQDPHVAYELGFALMSMRKFKEAKKYFAIVANDNEDFDAVLNLCVCETLDRNIEGARRLLQELTRLAKDDLEKAEVQHRRMVLKRLEYFSDKFSHKKNLNDRDWLFILYGSILLRPRLTIKHDAIVELSQVAATLVVLKIFLNGMDHDREAFEYYSLKSKPMVASLSHNMSLPFDSYKGPDRPDNALLMMCWTTDILGPHEAFIEHNCNRSLFAFGLSTVEPLPLVPDIVGCLSADLRMPWEKNEISVSESKKATDDLMERIATLESAPELVAEAQDAIDYYSDKRDLIIFLNAQKFGQRAEYTAELPLCGEVSA